MAKKDIPRWIGEYWESAPTEYSKDDIKHLEPGSELAVFLKYLLLNGFETLTLQVNGETLATFNGSNNVVANIDGFATLTLEVNGEPLATFNGSDDATAEIKVPVVTYGTEAPSGGNTGDVYMRYLA
jgi:hypothetical protein